MPTKRIVVYPYKMGSASAKLLAKELGAIRVLPDREFKPRTNDVIVNWGCGYSPTWREFLQSKNQVINHWTNVCDAIDKGISFCKFEDAGVRIPTLTTSRLTAIDWLERGNVVLGRTTLEGTRGQGIVEMSKLSQFQECRLYSKYEETTKEFRVYIFNGLFLDALEKRRNSDMLAANKINYRVRTEENGWVFCRGHVELPNECAIQAIKAVKALNLVFGGVDIIWNEPKKRATVLEVNTAPGIFGNTVTYFAEQITEYAEAL